MLVSGGHTQVIYVKDFDNHTIVASTIDDAVGEVYDKVARLMGLTYPGGIMLDKLAQEGNPNAFKLPEAKVGEDEFSFSGLKTALLRLTQSFKDKEIPQKDICASFQERVSDTLIKKTLNLADKYGCKTIVTAGGVAANAELRKKLFALNGKGYKTYAPAMKYCTDNAAMVGSCAYFNPIKCANPLEMEVFSRA